MAIDRRDFVLGTTATALGAMLPGSLLASTSEGVEAFEAEFQDTLAKVRNAFTQTGLTEIVPLPLLTSEPDFNGGLRYDADVTVIRPGEFVVQPSARTGDVAERTRGDLLPVFNVFACQHPHGVSRDEQVRIMFDVLLGTFELDPDRIAFASVPEAGAIRPVLSEIGFDYDAKMKIRDADESFSTRDTSGYFFPVRGAEEYIVSAGIYYRLTEDEAPGFSQYPPPPGWTEIAEVTVSGAEPPAMAIGIERLALAKTGLYVTWDQRLDALKARIESEGGDPEAFMWRFR